MSTISVSGPLRTSRIYDEFDACPPYRRAFEHIPVIGDFAQVVRMGRLWSAMDRQVTDRGIRPARCRITVQVAEVAAKTIGWTSRNFEVDDDIGAMFWDYRDVLAGVQGLIELEEKFSLPEHALDWELWEHRHVSELVELLRGVYRVGEVS